MQHLFLIGSQVHMSTKLVDPVTLTPAPPSGAVGVQVFKGPDLKAVGTATLEANGKWGFTYQPSAWETGDYLMQFAWETVVAGVDVDGNPVELLEPRSLGFPFSLRADLGSVRNLSLADSLHPCDFPWYQRINTICEFDELIDKQGKWFVLWHRYSSVHCSCWNDVNGTAVTSCPYCGGTGFPHKEIPFRGRDQFDDKEGRIFQVGSQLTAYMRFFALRDFVGIRGDQIWQVDWKRPDRPEAGFDRPPFKRYGIVFVKDHYGDNHDGRVTYKELIVEELTLNNNRAQVT